MPVFAGESLVLARVFVKNRMGFLSVRKREQEKEGIFVDHQSDGIKGISLPGQYFPVIRVVSNCYPQLDILFIWISTLGREQRHKHADSGAQWCEHTEWRIHAQRREWAHTHTHTDSSDEIILTLSCPYPHTHQPLTGMYTKLSTPTSTCARVHAAPSLQWKMQTARTINQ